MEPKLQSRKLPSVAVLKKWSKRAGSSSHDPKSREFDALPELTCARHTNQIQGGISEEHGRTQRQIKRQLQSVSRVALLASGKTGLRLTVNRYNAHLDVLITLRQQPGGVDGHCGNFNGDSSDDTKQLILQREVTEVMPSPCEVIRHKGYLQRTCDFKVALANHQQHEGDIAISASIERPAPPQTFAR
eukprot:6485756-Amphidinium_carterae.2